MISAWSVGVMSSGEGVGVAWGVMMGPAARLEMRRQTAPARPSGLVGSAGLLNGMPMARMAKFKTM